MSEVIKGRVLAKNIQEKVASRVAKLHSPLGLAVILIGDNAASSLYVSLKETAAKEAGIYVEKHILEDSVSQKSVITLIQSLNARKDIHGILVQLPLPSQLHETEIITSIHPHKDVDGFHAQNTARLLEGTPSIVPPIALAIMKLIDATRQPLRNKNAVIISNSEIFATPMIALLKERGVTGQYLSPKSQTLSNAVQAADIAIVAVGKTGFIKATMVSPHAILIDVGTNRTK